MARKDERTGKAAGEGGGEERPDGARRARPDDFEEVELDLSPLDLVTSLAHLDLEAALAYDAAAEASGEEAIARQLRTFAADHRRHLDGLNALLAGAGQEVAEPPAGVPLLTGLMRLAAPLGPEVTVVALLGNEQLTNLSYDAALAYEWEDQVEEMLQGFQADEERHLRWLSDQHDRLAGHGSGADLPAGE